MDKMMTRSDSSVNKVNDDDRPSPRGGIEADLGTAIEASAG
jgi:hypothetical protein